MTRDGFVLLGPLTVDRYVDEGLALPGGGVLNLAWHWRRRPGRRILVTRIGEGDRALFAPFVERHGLGLGPGPLEARGRSARIDIRLGRDGSPAMGNYDPGVWADLRLGTEEEACVARAASVFAVLVPPVRREALRLGTAGLLDGVEAYWDFLDYRFDSEASLSEAMRYAAVGFVGWPGTPGDAAVAGMRRVARRLGRLVVVTLGRQGVLALDGASERDVPWPALARDVSGSTVGCGDAFIAGFLAAREDGKGLEACLAAGTEAGATATAWRRALPDEAYGP